MSENIQIRPACLEDAAAIARLQVDSYRSAYAGIFPQDYLDQLSNNEQQGDRIEPLTSATSDVVLVAAEGDARLAGYALGRQQASFAAPYDSELASLHVCKALHRRGFGRMLVVRDRRQPAYAWMQSHDALGARSEPGAGLL